MKALVQLVCLIFLSSTYIVGFVLGQGTEAWSVDLLVDTYGGMVDGGVMIELPILQSALQVIASSNAASAAQDCRLCLHRRMHVTFNPTVWGLSCQAVVPLSTTPQPISNLPSDTYYAAIACAGPPLRNIAISLQATACVPGYVGPHCDTPLLTSVADVDGNYVVDLPPETVLQLVVPPLAGALTLTWAPYDQAEVSFGYGGLPSSAPTSYSGSFLEWVRPEEGSWLVDVVSVAGLPRNGTVSLRAHVDQCPEGTTGWQCQSVVHSLESGALRQFRLLPGETLFFTLSSPPQASMSRVFVQAFSESYLDAEYEDYSIGEPDRLALWAAVSHYPTESSALLRDCTREEENCEYVDSLDVLYEAFPSAAQPVRVTVAAQAADGLPTVLYVWADNDCIPSCSEDDFAGLCNEDNAVCECYEPFIGPSCDNFPVRRDSQFPLWILPFLVTGILILCLGFLLTLYYGAVPIWKSIYSNSDPVSI